MKKNFILSFCILCICGVSACRSFSEDQEHSANYLTADDESQVIDVTSNAQNRCGVDGISCNDTALINYTQTEADYRAYGERTKRDHLYTQASAGNNLTATIQPDIEDDVVIDYSVTEDSQQEIVLAENDIFSKTNLNEVVDQPISGIIPVSNENNGSETSANTTNTDLELPPSTSIVTTKKNGEPIKRNGEPVAGDDQVTKKTIKVGRVDNIVDNIKGPGYEIICEEECDEFAVLNNDDTITSEFTEESFDIAELDDSDSDTDAFKDDEGNTEDFDVEFNEIGEKNEKGDVIVKVASKQISDDAIVTWDAQQGDTLRELLTKWSAQSGWKLLWNTNRNYTLSAGAMFKGKFTDVSSALIRAFARARPAPVATFYKGNRVIVVETMENENAY